MAISCTSSSSDCSLTFFYSSSLQPHKLTFFSPCKSTLPSSSSCSTALALRVSPLNSSGCPSPTLEDHPSPTNVPIFQQQHLEFNTFLCGLLQDSSSQTQQLAYEYYKKAKESPGFIPDNTTFKLLIKCMVRSRKWDSILSLSHDFKTYHVFPDALTCSKLIAACIKARKFRLVNNLLDVFQCMDSENAVLVFDSAMRAYNKLHMYSSTIIVYERMKSAEIVLDFGCYCQITEAYKNIGDSETVVRLFRECESRELDATPTPFAIQIYRVLFESLGKSGRAFEALSFFRDMTIRKGISGDSCIYASLVSAFASIREVKVAEELFKEAVEKRMLRDPDVFLKLVLMYIERGLVEKTLEVVVAMKDAKRKVSDCILCTIVNGFSKRRGYWAAVKVYEHLKSYGCIPGQVTYASIINAYCRIGLYSKAEIAFQEMEKMGFDKCVVAYSSMVAMYGKTGRVRDAMRLVAKMKAKGCEPNVWTYNALMDMHGRAKNLRQVEKLWKEMKRKKVIPDKVSYTTIISAYNKAREFELCVNFYSEFRMNGGVIDRAMAGIMVGVFSKLSRIQELVKLLQDMKSEGTGLDERLYHSALNALRDAGLQMQAEWLQQNFEGT